MESERDTGKNVMAASRAKGERLKIYVHNTKLCVGNKFTRGDKLDKITSTPRWKRTQSQNDTTLGSVRIPH